MPNDMDSEENLYDSEDEGREEEMDEGLMENGEEDQDDEYGELENVEMEGQEDE